MKLKSPSSLQAWLFAAGAVLLLLAGVFFGMVSLVTGHHQAAAPSAANSVTAARLAFDIPISMLEFAGLSCIILAALVSIFRTILPPKPR